MEKKWEKWKRKRSIAINHILIYFPTHEKITKAKLANTNMKKQFKYRNNEIWFDCDIYTSGLKWRKYINNNRTDLKGKKIPYIIAIGSYKMNQYDKCETVQKRKTNGLIHNNTIIIFRNFKRAIGVLWLWPKLFSF